MLKRILVRGTWLLCGLLLAACSLIPPPAPQSGDAGRTPVAAILHQLELGTRLTDAPLAEGIIPDGVVPEQIGAIYAFGPLQLALIRVPSVNVPLALPENFESEFAGLLVREAGQSWQRLLKIKDGQAADKNNPYTLWVDADGLHLAIVDQTGAGSGEGMMTVARLAEHGTWEVSGCYYFGATYRGPAQDGDYFAFAQRLDQQQAQPLAACQSVTLVAYP